MPKILSSDIKDKDFAARPVKGVRLFVREKAISKMVDHAVEGYEKNEEVLGLMMGAVCEDDEGDYVIVLDVATSDLDADSVSVRFERNSFEQLFDSMDVCEGETVVGWYHSHPGFGCYLSDTDIRTHEGIFGKDTGFAIVIDPSTSTIVPFTCIDGKQEKAKMIVME